MSDSPYEPYPWEEDVSEVTASRLNHIEKGLQTAQGISTAESEALNSQIATLAIQLETLASSLGPLVAPTVVTSTPETPTPTSVTLKGSINPNGQAVTYWFEYGATSSLGNSTEHKTLSAETSAKNVSQAITAGSGQEFSAQTHYRLVAQSASGTSQGSTLQIGEMVPSSSPSSPTNVSGTEATLSGFVAANGLSTTVTFEYGTTTSYGKTISGGTVGAATEGPQPVTATVKEALSGTLHFRVKAVNSKGTTNSADREFTVSSASGTFLVGNSETTFSHTDQTTKGRVEAFQFTPTQSGTIKELWLRTNGIANTGVTGVIMGVESDASNKPSGTVLGSGEKSGTPGTNEWVKVTGLSIAITAGNPCWLCVLPLGGTLHYNAEKETGGTLAYESTSSLGELTTIGAATSWEQDSQGGPIGFQGIGSVAEGESMAPVLSVNSTNHQTVEWASVGAETEYSVALSLEPPSSGRATAYTNIAKITNPQKFKPEAGHTYGNAGATQLTPVAGQTVYIGVKAIPNGTWAHEVSVVLPGTVPNEEGSSTPSLVIGVYAGSGQTTGQIFPEAAAQGVKFYRAGQSGARSEAYVKAAAEQNIGVATTIFGGGTVVSQAAGAASLAKEIVSWYKQFGKGGTFWAGKTDRGCQWVEVMNEPGYKEERTKPNFEAYSTILKVVHETLEKEFPSAANRPLVLASVDNGNGNCQWGEGVNTAGGLAFADGVTVHPYGGSSGGFEKTKSGTIKSGFGNLAMVEEAWEKFKKPVYVTELGFPIEKSTSDSKGWTLAQQAQNIENFSLWIKESAHNYVKMFLYFSDYDEKYSEGTGSQRKYGVAEKPGLPRPGYATLGKFSKEAAGF